MQTLEPKQRSKAGRWKHVQWPRLLREVGVRGQAQRKAVTTRQKGVVTAAEEKTSHLGT